MSSFGSQADYERECEARAPLPRGFTVASAALKFHPRELPGDRLYPMTLSLIALDAPTDAVAGVFTRNAFPGAPVLLCRERIRGNSIRGILVNNKVANVCVQGGKETAVGITAALAEAAGGRSEEWLYASTGVIGWSLPEREIRENLPRLAAALQADSALPAARGIMTTDRWPKLRSVEVGGARITAMAKGAGMIEPNMATMLAFICTDADLPREELDAALREAVAVSFNAISVDGDQSTSDMALLLSSRRGPRVAKEEFVRALTELAAALAQDIVRNGEGTSHLIEVEVRGAPGREEAAGIARAVVNSPLVKTAVYGNDPNVGRILAAVGDYAGNNGIELDSHSLRIALGGREIFRDGEFTIDPAVEEGLSAYLKRQSFSSELKGYPEHDGRVEIAIDLGVGTGAARIWGSDLSYEYVRENAEYRS